MPSSLTRAFITKILPAFVLCVGTALAIGCSKTNDVVPEVASAGIAAQISPADVDGQKLTPYVDYSSVYRYNVIDINGQRVNLGR